jgi:hypothetical protein
MTTKRSVNVRMQRIVVPIIALLAVLIVSAASAQQAVSRPNRKLGATSVGPSTLSFVPVVTYSTGGSDAIFYANPAQPS